jgi:hypothetical protein
LTDQLAAEVEQAIWWQSEDPSLVVFKAPTWHLFTLLQKLLIMRMLSGTEISAYSASDFIAFARGMSELSMQQWPSFYVLKRIIQVKTK